jgi:hypothetical protein
MKLYHSAPWEALESILTSEAILPQPVGASDRTNLVFDQLAKIGIDCAWLSSQTWSSNHFGAYTFAFEASDIVLANLVDLGDHNSARCYLSVPPLLASWVAKKLGKTVVESVTNTILHPKSKDDRVDMLVGWRVPMSTDVHFTSTTRIRKFLIEGDANFAKVRFAAKMLISKDVRFNSALEPVEKTAHLLWCYVTGRFVARFDRSRKYAIENPESASNREFLCAALTALTEANLDLAAICAAYIGEATDIAEELASLLNEHFTQTSLTGEAIMVETC